MKNDIADIHDYVGYMSSFDSSSVIMSHIRRFAYNEPIDSKIAETLRVD